MSFDFLLNKEIPVFLAPMAGVTDAPFRNIVNKFGATATVSEMISSEALTRNSEKTYRRIRSDNDIKIVQIMGSDPQKMAESAKINEAYGASVIDVNMGCPAKKIVNNNSGSALLKDEQLAVSIAAAVVNAVKIPVTLKMRLGWDENHKNFVKLSKEFERVGIKMLTLHCRTRSQMYSGRANWEEISILRDIINIPYLCNGDIKTPEDAISALRLSKASGIMIGRAALGRPWLINQILKFLNKNEMVPCPNLKEQYQVAMEHFYKTLEFYGKQSGLKIFRKHFCWYSSGLPNASIFREQINKSDDLSLTERLVKEFYEKITETM